MIDSVSSGERKRRSPNHPRVGFGPRRGIVEAQANGLGRPAKGGDSPVAEARRHPSGTQSTTGHVKSCRKDCRPLQKAKYYLVTDSAPVP